MLGLILVLSAVDQTPKTFDALEIEKIKVYREMKAFRETMRITFFSEEGQPEALRVIELDGGRERSVFTVPGGAKMETVCDGTTKRVIIHSDKFYTESAADKKRDVGSQDLATAAPDEMNLDFSIGGLPVRFACKPPFELKSVKTVKDGSETLRRVVSVATKGPGRIVSLTQWFLPDQWLLKRFKIEGTGNSGPVSIEGVAKLEFGVTFNPDTFKLDPKTVEGYRRVGFTNFRP